MPVENKYTVNKKPNHTRLKNYGFKKVGETLVLTKNILDGTFSLTVTVVGEETRWQVIDLTTEEEYSLAYVKDSVGYFVGSVRTSCAEIMEELVTECYDNDVFKSDFAHLIMAYVREKYGDSLEYLWQKFPNNAILREKSTQKWYATFSAIDKSIISPDEKGLVEIITLKANPDLVTGIDGKRFYPAYHMNKTHWYTVCLDGSVPISEIYERIDASYRTIIPKTEKKRSKK